MEQESEQLWGAGSKRDRVKRLLTRDAASPVAGPGEAYCCSTRVLQPSVQNKCVCGVMYRRGGNLSQIFKISSGPAVWNRTACPVAPKNGTYHTKFTQCKKHFSFFLQGGRGSPFVRPPQIAILHETGEAWGQRSAIAVWGGREGGSMPAA